MDFRNKIRESGGWTIPCSVSASAGKRLYEYEVFAGDDRGLEVRLVDPARMVSPMISGAPGAVNSKTEEPVTGVFPQESAPYRPIDAPAAYSDETSLVTYIKNLVIRQNLLLMGVAASAFTIAIVVFFPSALSILPGWANTAVFFMMGETLCLVSARIKGEKTVAADWARALVITPLAIGALVGVFMTFACGTYITLIPNDTLAGKFMRVFTHQTATVVPVMLWCFLVSGASDRPKEWIRAIKGLDLKGIAKEMLSVWRSRRGSVVKVNAIAATIWVPISWFTLNGAISPDYMASVFAIITVPWSILLVWLLRSAGRHLSQDKATRGPEALAGFGVGAGIAYYSLNVGIFNSIMGWQHPLCLAILPLAAIGGALLASRLRSDPDGQGYALSSDKPEALSDGDRSAPAPSAVSDGTVPAALRIPLKADRSLLAGLDTPEGAARGILDSVFSALLKDKVVLAFDENVAGIESARLLSVFEGLKEMKRDKRYSAFLENLVIIRSSPAKLREKIDEVKGDKAKVFIFADENSRPAIPRTVPESITVYVDNSNFPVDAYHPLVEIVAITLASYISPEALAQARPALESVNIRMIEEDGSVLIFRLLPSATLLNTHERLKRYGLIKEALRSA